MPSVKVRITLTRISSVLSALLKQQNGQRKSGQRILLYSCKVGRALDVYSRLSGIDAVVYDTLKKHYLKDTNKQKKVSGSSSELVNKSQVRLQISLL